MVLVCSDTSVRDSPQNLPQRDLVMASGAGFEQMRAPGTAAEDVATAMRRAVTERRPIALNMPGAFETADVDYQSRPYYVAAGRPTLSAGEDLDNAIGIIAAAKRPIILAGRGAVSEEARSAILRLAKRIEAPVATTLKAKDLFRGEDCNLGIFGTLSSPATVDMIVESDCVISFGASLSRFTMSSGSFRPGKRYVQVNLEPNEVGKNIQPDAGLVGDPAGVADTIVHWLDEAEIPPSGWCSDELKERIAADKVRGESKPDGDGTVDFRGALARLDELLPDDRVLVTDGGRFMRAAFTDIGGRGPDSFVFTINIGSIGLGLPYAIGASFAAKGRPTVLVTGDGGFMHGGLAEFNTAVRYKRDLVVVVCNDGAYGAEHIKFRGREMDPASILFDWPEFAPLASALGGDGVTVRSGNDWGLVAEAINNRQAPLLIDVKLDPDRMN
jgi:thiamine pyrophosphate-dependent acetolactate synthase large subunit-like protein